VFDEDRAESDDSVVHQVQLKSQYGEVFYDKLTFIYLTLPNFKKTLAELKTTQDKWFYIFRHLHEMDAVPDELQEKIFLQLFEVAQLARFDPAERKAYQDSLKYYRDLKNVTDTAWEEGREEGREEERLEMAKKLLSYLDDAAIAETTGLSVNEVVKLRGIVV